MTHATNRRRQRRRKRFRLFPLLFSAVMFVFAVLFLSSFGSGYISYPLGLSTLPTYSSATHSSNANPSVSYTSEFPAFGRQIHLAEIEDTQYLRLVNRTHSIAEPMSDTKFVTIYPSVPTLSPCVSLHETVFYAIQELFAYAKGAGYSSLIVASGFRCYNQQAHLYQNAHNRDYVLPPGHSEHQLGLAADILTPYHDFQSIRDTPQAKWLATNAPAFGLILRYPADKTDITEVAYEPWHFRYVGRIHAWYMSVREFVLEEYIEYLREGNGYQVEFEGKTYYVLYQQPENDMIFVPEDMSFWVSSTTSNGYIITAWR